MGCDMSKIDSAISALEDLLVDVKDTDWETIVCTLESLHWLRGRVVEYHKPMSLMVAA